MPLYEYECESCQDRFERIQKFSDPPVEICPACGGRVRKLLSSPAIQFKGSGWYITDYARKRADASKPGADAAGKSEATTDSKTESKAEGKAETPASSTPKTDSQ